MIALALIGSLVISAPPNVGRGAIARAVTSADAGAEDLVEITDKISQSATPDQVQLGEPFVYDIQISHPPEERWELLTPTALGDFELGTHTRERVEGSPQSVTTFKLNFQLFEFGEHRVPTLEFTVNNGVKERRVPVVGVPVTGIASAADAQNDAKLRDIKPNVDVPIPSYRLVWGALAVLALVAAGYALFRYLRRPKPVVAVAEQVPPLEVRTQAALDALVREDLPGQGRTREFYFRLSEIVRGYLGDRYGIEALESTSEELLSDVHDLQAAGLSLPDLKRFVDDSELAKFARAPMTAEACQNSLQFAYRLVRDTSHASGT